LLTGLGGDGLVLLLGTDSSRSLAAAVGRLAMGWIPCWGIRELFRVHLNTVPLKHRLKSKIFLKSYWLVAMASVNDAGSVHFLQKFVNREPAALRHQAGAGRQQADYARGVQAPGPQSG